MDQHVINPFNKIDISRLPVEGAITLADLLLFQKVTAVGKKERQISVQQFLAALLPANLRLSQVVSSPGITLTDHMVFVSNAAADPKERKATLTEIINVILPSITPPLTTSITPPGVFMPYVGVSAPSGWLLASGMTIGNPTSGATSRANADTLPLYTLLWTSYANLQLPIQDNVGVPAVRGASAAVDFAAGKRLPLPDLRGRVVVGGDSMGGVAANRVTTAGSGIDGATHGTTGGSQSVILTEGNLPAHTHDTLVPTTTPATGTSGATGTSPGASSAVASDSTGNGEAFPIAQPSIVANYIIKL